MHQYDKALVWFRRDLRASDHAALYHALKQSRQVYCVFIYDSVILDELAAYDRRVEFIHGSIAELAQRLKDMGGDLIVRHANAGQEIPHLAMELEVNAVFFNHDYEPAAIRRDEDVRYALDAVGCACHTFKDQVIFEKNEVLTLAGNAFSVFTPYKNAWLKRLHERNNDFYYRAYPVEQYSAHLAQPPAEVLGTMPGLEAMGFEKTNLREVGIEPGETGASATVAAFLGKMSNYHDHRDIPSIAGTSWLSVHLRFGTVSLRSLVRLALEKARQYGSATGAETWLNELIWRDFYFMVLFNNPGVVTGSFKPIYDRITWETGEQAEAHFQAWCEGRTGYPLVDAAMLQLAQTGYMHNRLRMLVGSFLCKDLGLDWRWGERFFAQHLNDFDLAANNGGWQWASSSGADAAPYFRIFSPVRQSERFDQDGTFIRSYLPQLARLSSKQIHAPWLVPPLLLEGAGVTLGKDYPAPIVQHDVARKQTLARYEVVKKGGEGKEEWNE
jgi:deoxyribodipyrimidine photo-lyase